MLTDAGPLVALIDADERRHAACRAVDVVMMPLELMAKYADTPMDLADATLVALAEERGERRISTLDSDFLVYRLDGRRALEVLPD